MVIKGVRVGPLAASAAYNFFFSLFPLLLFLAPLLGLGGNKQQIVGWIANWIGGVLHIGPAFVLAWKIVQFPIAIAGLVALAFLTFNALPNVKQHVDVLHHVRGPDWR